LKLKLLLVAVVVAAINADDTDYYDDGVSIGIQFPRQPTLRQFQEFL